MRTTELSHSSNVTELLRFIIARVQPVPVAFSWPVAFSLWPASSLRGLILFGCATSSASGSATPRNSDQNSNPTLSIFGFRFGQDTRDPSWMGRSR